MTALHPPQHQVPAPPPQRPRGPRGLIIALIITAVIAVVAITALVTVQLTSNDATTPAAAPATTTAAPATDSPLEARAAAKAKSCAAYNAGDKMLADAALPGISPQNWDAQAAQIPRVVSVSESAAKTIEAGIDPAAGATLSATMRTLVDKMRETNRGLEARDANRYLAANSAATAAASGVQAVCAA